MIGCKICGLALLHCTCEADYLESSQHTTQYWNKLVNDKFSNLGEKLKALDYFDTFDPPEG